MRALVKWIESTPAQLVATQESPREAALLAVYDWVQDWSECARTVITRRDQLIRLGIGKRRARSANATPTPADADAVTRRRRDGRTRRATAGRSDPRASAEIERRDARRDRDPSGR